MAWLRREGEGLSDGGKKGGWWRRRVDVGTPKNRIIWNKKNKTKMLVGERR